MSLRSKKVRWLAFAWVACWLVSTLALAQPELPVPVPPPKPKPPKQVKPVVTPENARFSVGVFLVEISRADLQFWGVRDKDPNLKETTVALAELVGGFGLDLLNPPNLLEAKVPLARVLYHYQWRADKLKTLGGVIVVARHGEKVVAQGRPTKVQYMEKTGDNTYAVGTIEYPGIFCEVTPTVQEDGSVRLDYGLKCSIISRAKLEGAESLPVGKPSFATRSIAGRTIVHPAEPVIAAATVHEETVQVLLLRADPIIPHREKKNQ